MGRAGDAQTAATKPEKEERTFVMDHAADDSNGLRAAEAEAAAVMASLGLGSDLAPDQRPAHHGFRPTAGTEREDRTLPEAFVAALAKGGAVMNGVVVAAVSRSDAESATSPRKDNGGVVRTEAESFGSGNVAGAGDGGDDNDNNNNNNNVGGRKKDGTTPRKGGKSKIEDYFSPGKRDPKTDEVAAARPTAKRGAKRTPAKKNDGPGARGGAKVGERRDATNQNAPRRRKGCHYWVDEVNGLRGGRWLVRETRSTCIFFAPRETTVRISGALAIL